MSLGIDTTQNDQMVRGSVSLPHGIGKAVRLLVFCQGDNVAKAKEAGADYAGSDEFIKKIQQEGWLDFDVALATQDMMGQVSRLGRVLGPRGLMPTPKAGTVITAGGDVAAAVREFKAGKVEYRADKGGNVHAGVGKMSFDDDKLADNITTVDNGLRQTLRKKNIHLQVVKNSLTRRVFDEMGLRVNKDSPYWAGPTLMAWGAGSIAELSQALDAELNKGKGAAQFKDKVT